MGHVTNNRDPFTFRLIDPTTKRNNLLVRRVAHEIGLEVVTNNGKSQLKKTKSNDKKVVVLKVAGSKRKMDDVHSTFSLKKLLRSLKFLEITILKVTSPKGAID